MVSVEVRVDAPPRECELAREAEGKVGDFGWVKDIWDEDSFLRCPFEVRWGCRRIDMGCSGGPGRAVSWDEAMGSSSSSCSSSETTVSGGSDGPGDGGGVSGRGMSARTNRAPCAGSTT